MRHGEFVDGEVAREIDREITVKPATLAGPPTVMAAPVSGPLIVAVSVAPGAASAVARVVRSNQLPAMSQLPEPPAVQGTESPIAVSPRGAAYPIGGRLLVPLGARSYAAATRSTVASSK